MSKRNLPTDKAGHELRVFDSTAVIQRSDDPEDNSLRFRGHASVSNTETLIGGRSWGFMESVATGAFANALERSDVRLLLNHDSNLLLARSKSGTLTLSEDDIGLVSEADMAPVSYARDAAVLLERGDLSQMSFAFTVKSDEWETVTRSDENGDTYKIDRRNITEIDTLYDVSIVTYPAYPTTDAALASAVRSQGRALLEAICARLGISPSDEVEEITHGDLLARHLRNKHTITAYDLRRSN